MNEQMVLAILAARQVILLEMQLAEARGEIERLKVQIGPQAVAEPDAPPKAEET